MKKKSTKSKKPATTTKKPAKKKTTKKPAKKSAPSSKGAAVQKTLPRPEDEKQEALETLAAQMEKAVAEQITSAIKLEKSKEAHACVKDEHAAKEAKVMYLAREIHDLRRGQGHFNWQPDSATPAMDAAGKTAATKAKSDKTSAGKGDSGPEVIELVSATTGHSATITISQESKGSWKCGITATDNHGNETKITGKGDYTNRSAAFSARVGTLIDRWSGGEHRDDEKRKAAVKWLREELKSLR